MTIQRRLPLRPTRSAQHSRFVLASALVVLVAAPRFGAARTPPQQNARHWFEEGKRTGIAGRADSSLQFFTRAAREARTVGDEAMFVAAERGRADVWLSLRGCADSAVRILRDANAAAGPGDRSAADALIRLHAARGDAASARAVLVAAYSDAEGVGRTITRETIAFLRGRAATELAGGHESAAMSTLSEALLIAERLHAGDAKDTAGVHAVGEVTSENAWVLFDLAQLRANAKSPSVRSARESTRLMGLLTAAWDVVDDARATPFPTVRLGDRLILRAEVCRRAGNSCPVPKPSPGC
jgi:hypothetical protein